MSYPQSDPPIYGAMMAQQPQMQTPAPVNPQPNLEADTQAMIDAAISRVEAKYAQRIQQLEEQLKAQQFALPAGAVAEHGAGPGYESAPSWGLMHQEMSRAGTLTEDALRMTGLTAKAV